MTLTLDLHSHSGYSGGVGQISLEAVAKAMILKGIDVFGTGDALHLAWHQHLKDVLVEKNLGLYQLSAFPKKYFILQTEIIASFPFQKQRKSFHLVLLFPNHLSVEKTRHLLEVWHVKNTIGRPFLVCDSLKELSDRLFQIQEVHPFIEIIPAHVLTPQGALGSKNPVDSLYEAFGSFTPHIRMIETGLSADPPILEMIPELQNLTYLSNSDTHSADLRRIGREFTVVKPKELTYPSILESLRANEVIYTGEFSIAEGRFFLTGHRKGKVGHEKNGIFFYPNQTPENGLCPQCKKPLTIGVLERAIKLSQIQGGTGKVPLKTKRDFITLVPLLEVLSVVLKKGHTSKIVLQTYHQIVKEIPETALWLLQEQEIKQLFKDLKLSDEIIEGILDIKKGSFTYEPMGYDGEYGNLTLGKKVPFYS